MTTRTSWRQILRCFGERKSGDRDLALRLRRGHTAKTLVAWAHIREEKASTARLKLQSVKPDRCWSYQSDGARIS